MYSIENFMKDHNLTGDGLEIQIDDENIAKKYFAHQNPDNHTWYFPKWLQLKQAIYDMRKIACEIHQPILEFVPSPAYMNTNNLAQT